MIFLKNIKDRITLIATARDVLRGPGFTNGKSRGRGGRMDGKTLVKGWQYVYQQMPTR
ncbi:hypothetical protein ES705_30070 [subsurface metagenome]